MNRPTRSTHPVGSQRNVLGLAEGVSLCNATEALVKSLLESELATELLTAPVSSGFTEIAELSRLPDAGRLLADHELTVRVTDTAARAVAMADRISRSGRCAVAVVPNSQLDRTMGELTTLTEASMSGGGASCVILEDHPAAMPASCPRRAAARLNMPAMEPTGLDEFRDIVEIALRMSRGAAMPVAVIVHKSILQSVESLEMRPNRVGNYVSIHRADRHRQRRLRFSESSDVMRLARRVELNSARALPSPGERVPVGFITVGPADRALRHLTEVLKLHGRIPTLSLGLLNPLDESAVARMLTRCEKVVVLEPRPGSVELMLLQVSEQMRQSGAECATIWGRVIPADDEGNRYVLRSDEDLHPSVLVRKVHHLLHEIRPTLSLSAKLAPDPPKLSVRPQPRAMLTGPSAAHHEVQRLLLDLDDWLRQRRDEDATEVRPSALAIDGVVPTDGAERSVYAETWSREAFLDRGLSALAQAAGEDEPWLLVICDFPFDAGPDIERLARSAVPSRRADRVRLRTGDINATVELREKLREAAVNDGLTVLIIRDGPPHRYDSQAIARELREVDRLGFEPVQRAHWAADKACEFRPARLKLPTSEAVASTMPAGRSEVIVDTLPHRLGRQFRARLRLLEEMVEITRTRPPVAFWRGAESPVMPSGQPVHASQPQWRAHLAGFRGPAPGFAAQILCDAGQRMGYAVHCVFDPTPIGPGRSAWAQILYTRADPESLKPDVVPSIPYGEADLLLGLDLPETFRAVGRDDKLCVAEAQRTCAVINSGMFADESDPEAHTPLLHELPTVLAQCARIGHVQTDDFARACRVGFYSDRVTDIVLLGAAFQRGLIPVSYAAMDAAVKQAESLGVGRAADAFEFGRRLADDPDLILKQRPDADESVGAMRRRLALALSTRRVRGRRKSQQFDGLIDRSLRGMPGLTETDAGRQARRDFTAAVYRCVVWGGLKYAERYADAIVQLYHADRGDTGRALTRASVLPLAEAMLIRDPLYMASMAMDPEHRRRIRRQLNVKPARGDQMQRRYLTRLELALLHRRYRLNVRASDWVAAMMALAQPMIPDQLRGARRDRRVKAIVAEYVQHARYCDNGQYERCARTMQKLHHLAQEGALRTMPVSDLRDLLDGAHNVALPAMSA